MADPHIRTEERPPLPPLPTTPLLDSSQTYHPEDQELEIKDTQLDQTLQSVEAFLTLLGFNQSSVFSFLLSWFGFLVIGVLLPVLVLVIFNCSDCDKYQIEGFELVIVGSQACLAAVSFLCLSHNLRKYGIQRFLFVDRYIGHMVRFRNDYIKQIKVSKAVVQQRNHQNPEWIEGFLKASFFVSCAAHPYISNHLNRYCVTCQISGCHYCMNSGHPPGDHETLKIYRHVYRDAVLLSEMDKHLDCRQILPYKSNHSLVIALKPLPHFGGLSKFSCQTCGRRVNPQYLYCCLHCKVAAMSSKSSGASSSAPPFLGDQNKKRVAKPENSLHRRKGKPFRAPLF